MGDAETDGGHGYKIGEHICRSWLTTGSEAISGAFYNHLPSTSNRWDSVKPHSFRHEQLYDYKLAVNPDDLMIPRPQPANEVRS